MGLGPTWRALAQWLIAAALVVAHGSALAVEFDALRRNFRSSESVLLDRHGEPLHRLRTDASVRRGAWVSLANTSAALRQALVLSEDKRFYEHSGVDWRAVSAAAWANLWNSRTRGASTLTMQLAGLLDDDLKLGAGGRTLRQKIGQAVMATRLESSWRKDQILEAYLNLVPLRGELVGIDALSRTLFGKAPHGLNDAEAAITAALVRAPNARASAVAQRACGVLTLMRPSDTRTDCMALEMQTELALGRRAWASSDGVAPHLARRVLGSSEAGTRSLHSTLDAALQRAALQLLQQQIAQLKGRNVEDGAALVLENATGEVLAWVGSTGPFSAAAEVDGVTAARQPGSTLKPFLYAEALAERRLTAASLLDDSPAHLQTASGLYIPQNYDRAFKGWVSVRTALAASLNVPAVRTLVMVSPDSFARQLAAFGISLREGGDYYGYSLALGSPEVTLLQLTNAYRALAIGGRLSPVRWQFAPGCGPQARATVTGTAPKRCAPAFTPAITPQAAFIIADILADPNARARTFGTDSLLATRFWTAVKTGTSKDMRDNWAIGFSERYTVGVWIGNASGAPMWDVSGTSGAAPVWAALMRELHRQVPSRPPIPPAGVVRRTVRFSDAVEAAREEWFTQGTEQAQFTIESGANKRDPTSAAASKGIQNSISSARILAPVDGTILALDPDIPPNRQRLMLQAEASAGGGAALRWWIDQHEIGRGERVPWLPWPGRHRIQLKDGAGRLLDERRIEVRGAAVKPGARPPR